MQLLSTQKYQLLLFFRRTNTNLSTLSPNSITIFTGMNPQQRIDIRAKFEGDKYNILVATSVLEEGIDIQACNMVVRYMYVRDMIAKIQSMGKSYSLS